MSPLDLVKRSETGAPLTTAQIDGNWTDIETAVDAVETATEELQAAQIITPQQFGAVGDGVTNDAPAIQAAIDAAFTAGGGVVYLPYTANGYAITTSLLLKNNVSLEGGASRPLIKKIGALNTFGTGAVIYNSEHSGTSNNNIHIRSLTIKSRYQDFLTPVADTGETIGLMHGIVFAGVTNFSITDCHVLDTPAEGIYLGRFNTDLCEDGIVRDNLVQNCFASGIAVTNGNRIKIIGNTIRNSRLFGIDVEPNTGCLGTNIVIADNIIDGVHAGYYKNSTGYGQSNALGISLSNGSSGNPTHHINVTGNNIRDIQSYTVGGILDFGGISLSAVFDCTVVGNIVSNSDPCGVVVRGGCYGCTVTGNHISNVDQQGIRVSQSTDVVVADNSIKATGASGIVVITSCTDISVDGNSVVDAVTTGIIAQGPTTARVKINNNVVRDTRVGGARLMTYGIHLSSGLTDPTVIGNQIDNTTSDAIRNADSPAGMWVINGNNEDGQTRIRWGSGAAQNLHLYGDGGIYQANWMTLTARATSGLANNSLFSNSANNNRLTWKDGSGILHAMPGPEITPQMFGAVGNGVADDTAAFQIAVNAGVPLTLPAGSIYKFADREGVRLSSNAYIKGIGGKIVTTSSTGGPWRAFTVGFPYITTNVDYSNIVIDGVEFEGAVDEQFSHFIMLANPGGDLADVWIKNNKFKYTGGHTATGDRWAISLGGRPADARTNIHIEGNYCEGRMQLTGNGQDANWTDLYIDDNVVRGSQISGIALSRLSNGTGIITTYTRIRIRRNDIYSATNGTIGIHLGADSSSISDDPQVWSDVEISGNTFDIGGASAIDILFRSGQGASSSVAALRILNNNCKSIINASLALTRHTGTAPASFEAVVVDNVFRKDVSASVGNTVLQGNHIRGQVLPSGDAIVRMLHNQINVLRMEAAASSNVVRSEYNVYRVLNGQRAINIEIASGTADFISANDTFEYGDTTGSATSAIRVAGAGGTITAILKDFITNYHGWSAGLISQNNGKTVSVEGQITPQMFGAVGNGVADDTTALQAFLTALGNGVDGEMDGTYSINTMLVMSSKSKFILSGFGTIKMANGVTVSDPNGCIRFVTCNDFIIRDFTVDGNRANRTISGELGCHNVNFRTCHRFIVENIKSINACTDGFYMASSTPTTKSTHSDYFTFRNCSADNSWRQGMSIIQGNNGQIVGGFFKGTTGGGPEAGIDLEPNSGDADYSIEKISILDVLFENNDGPGLLVSQVSKTRDIHVARCLFKDSGTRGVEWAGTDNGLLEDCIFDGATNETTRGVIDVPSSPTSGDLDIVRPLFRNMTFNAAGNFLVYIDSNSYGRVRVKGLRCDTCFQIASLGADCWFDDSVISAVTGTLGVFAGTGGDRCKVRRNKISAFAGSAISLSGDNVEVTDNILMEPTVNTSGGALRVLQTGGVIDRNFIYRAASAAGYGIRLDDSFRSLQDNRIEGFTGNPIYLIGASATEAIGYKRRNITNGVRAAENNNELSAVVTFNPASLADGAGETTTVTVTDAAPGDLVLVSFSNDLQGITLSAYVSAANTVSVRFQNETGGIIDLASGNLRVRVFEV